MFFKHSVAVVALAALASAAYYKRVACPDGKNTATNEAVCLIRLPLIFFTSVILLFLD
jgi:hypothetical protein